MQIHLSSRHMPLTGAIHQYVAEKLQPVETLTESIIAAHVVLLLDEAKTKPYTVKAHLAVPGPDLHAEASSDNLYNGIDAVTSKLQQLLRKRKTKLVEHKKHRLQQAQERRKKGA